MLLVTVLFFIAVVHSRYSDNVDMAKTIEDTLKANVDLSGLGHGGTSLNIRFGAAVFHRESGCVIT